MNVMMLFELLPRNKIQLSAFTFRFGTPSSFLQKSIEQFGLLVPLLVLKKGENYLLLDGVLRLQSLSCDLIPCHIVEDQGPQAAFLLALESNRWNRDFNLIETALLIQQARDLDCDGLVLEKLGIKNLHIKKDYLLLLQLPLKIQQASVNLAWPLHVAVKWDDILPDEREALFDELQKLSLNSNKWGDILVWLADISKRDKGGALAIVREIQASLASITDPIQLSQLFREELERRRFPRLKAQQEKFQSVLKEAKLPKSLQIEPSPYFESRDIFLKTKISSQEDAEKIKQSLDPRLVKVLLDVVE